MSAKLPAAHYPLRVVTLRLARRRRWAIPLDSEITTAAQSPFAAFTYALAYLVVTSAREFIDNSFSMPNNDHRYAGIPT